MKKISVENYRDENRPHLKFVCNYEGRGQGKRRFFEVCGDADLFAAHRNVELNCRWRGWAFNHKAPCVAKSAGFAYGNADDSTIIRTIIGDSSAILRSGPAGNSATEKSRTNFPKREVAG